MTTKLKAPGKCKTELNSTTSSPVVDADMEGIVTKCLGDAYQPKHVRWHKVLNRSYSQRHGRVEWFRERRASK
jgi:hypothetical protein